MDGKSKARLPMVWRAILLGILAVAVGIGLWLFMGRERKYELTAFAMGSYVQQTVWGREPEKAASETVQRIEALEEQISWRRKGDVARINSAAGSGSVTLDESTPTGNLLAGALELSQRSGGALDVTLGPVTMLWDFDNEPRVPHEDELREALALVGYDRLSVESQEYMYGVQNEDGSHTDCLGTRYEFALPEAGMSLDLGAVGKGAACDTAEGGFNNEGISAMVVSVGGSVGLFGKKPGGGDWQVAVRDPAGQGSLGVLGLTGGFVSTSGSYEKYFEEDGRKYCHLIDPRTGYPAESGLVSVTVWCPPDLRSECSYPGALSDGLATACFVLGLEDGMKLLESYGAEGIFIDGDNVLTVTGGLRDRFTLTAEGYTLSEEG